MGDPHCEADERKYFNSDIWVHLSWHFRDFALHIFIFEQSHSSLLLVKGEKNLHAQYNTIKAPNDAASDYKEQNQEFSQAVEIEIKAHFINWSFIAWHVVISIATH